MIDVIRGENYAVAQYGAPERWLEHVIDHPKLGPVPGKSFLRDVLGLTAMEVSVGLLPPGAGIPFLHAHEQNEELYLFLSGTGEMQVDGEIVPVRAGSAVRIGPKGLRGWRNSGTEPMAYIVIQAKSGSLEQATGEDGIVGQDPPRW